MNQWKVYHVRTHPQRIKNLIVIRGYFWSNNCSKFEISISSAFDKIDNAYQSRVDHNVNWSLRDPFEKFENSTMHNVSWNECDSTNNWKNCRNYSVWLIIIQFQIFYFQIKIQKVVSLICFHCCILVHDFEDFFFEFKKLELFLAERICRLKLFRKAYPLYRCYQNTYMSGRIGGTKVLFNTPTQLLLWSSMWMVLKSHWA